MKALVTGIKPYLARLSLPWSDHKGPHFDGFETIRTKDEVVSAARFNGNTGNYFIGEAAIEAVGRDKATFVNFGALHAKINDPDYLAAIQSQFDCVVLVTANLLRSDYDAALEADLLSKLNLPIVVLGAGCQRKRDLPASIPEGTLRLVGLLNSKEHHVFTRGSVSADYLRSKGLRQVWPTGCPSMFMRPHNIVAAMRALTLVDWTAKQRIAFSGHIGRDAATVRDIELFENRQNDCNYVLQDEPLCYGLEFDAQGDAEIYNDMSGEVSRVCLFQGSAAIPDIRMRIFFNTHQWRAVTAMHDVSFGRRFHGVVAALQSGVPGLMIAVDDRMREMLDQFELPYIDIGKWNDATDKLALIKSTAAAFDADRFCERHLEAAELFRTRMASLGLG